MCRRRFVCYIYRQCGHAVSMPEEIVLCNLTYCKFSPEHSPSCVPPACQKTCYQQRQSPPEQYSPHLDARCPACIA